MVLGFGAEPLVLVKGKWKNHLRPEPPIQSIKRGAGKALSLLTSPDLVTKCGSDGAIVGGTLRQLNASLLVWLVCRSVSLSGCLFV